MLFNRFILIAFFIALCGITLLQVLAATNPHHADFAVGKRLQQWQKFDAERACKANADHCAVVVPAPLSETVS